MGKVLVIKNADFTENSIVTWQKASRVAMPNNLYHYYIRETDGAYTYHMSQDAYYIEVEAGTLLKIKFGKTSNNETAQQRCGFYQTMPSAGSISPLYYNNKDDAGEIIDEHIMEVPFNGIFIISRYAPSFKDDEELFIGKTL